MGGVSKVVKKVADPLGVTGGSSGGAKTTVVKQAPPKQDKLAEDSKQRAEIAEQKLKEKRRSLGLIQRGGSVLQSLIRTARHPGKDGCVG